MDIKKITNALETALEEVRKEDLTATLEIDNQSGTALLIYLTKQNDKYSVVVRDCDRKDDATNRKEGILSMPGDTLNIKFTLNAISQEI